MGFKAIYITNELPLINILKNIEGIRFFVDTEVLGKAERQKNLGTHLGNHLITDVKVIKDNIKNVEVMVRVNPVNNKTVEEVDLAVYCGADMIMLPMFTTVEEVQFFLKCVNKRTKTCLLFETAPSLARIDSILTLDNIDEAYIGLNDMSISMGLKFLFEVLSGGLVEYMGKKFKEKNIPWGFGGLARLSQGELPAEIILSEHVRLGSTRVILSQAFRNKVDEKVDIIEEIQKVLAFEKKLQSFNSKQLLDNHLKIVRMVKKIVE